MFALLGKKGYEKEAEILNKRLEKQLLNNFKEGNSNFEFPSLLIYEKKNIKIYKKIIIKILISYRFFKKFIYSIDLLK